MGEVQERPDQEDEAPARATSLSGSPRVAADVPESTKKGYVIFCYKDEQYMFIYNTNRGRKTRGKKWRDMAESDAK